MDLNHLLIWTVAAGCGITLLQLPWQLRALRLALLPGLILLVLGVSLLIVPDAAGLISGGLFILFMLVPAWGTVLLNSLLIRKRYRVARRVAQVLALLRPDRDSRRLPRVIQAMQFAQVGQQELAVERLKKIVGSHSPLERMALVLRTRLTGDWQEYLHWANAPENRPSVLTDSNLLETWLQAWGETGQRDELFRHYVELQPQWSRFPEFLGNLIRMKLAAFSGDELLVVQLLQGRLQELPAELKMFWRATATQVAGHPEEAAPEFLRLAARPDAGLAGPAQRRLEASLPDINAFPLKPEQQVELRRIAQHAEGALQQAMFTTARTRRCSGTWGLVALLGLVFLLEIPGGSENFENLERMGAMLIPAPPGESSAWRMVTAAFLHFGPLHLMMNVLGLVVLGRRIEQEWGTWRMVLTYLLAAIGAIGLAPFFIQLHPLEGPTVLVGASGGVMGLLGGLLLQSLVHLLQGRSRLAGREFFSLLVIVLLQLAFDANTPNVSSEAHLLGMTLGIACGGVWNLIWLLRRRSPQARP